MHGGQERPLHETDKDTVWILLETPVFCDGKL